MAHKIQIKRGNKADLPVLNDGEMGLCIDTQEVFIGSNGTNIPVSTNYTHPPTHPASMIVESISKRFVSDTEKTAWNGKQDVLGYTPVDKSGDTMTGKLTLPVSIATSSGLNIPHGSTPTTLANGDIWTTTTSILARINGSTRTMYHNGNLATVTQAEAEAGKATTVRAWTSQRVAQAINAKLPTKLSELEDDIGAGGGIGSGASLPTPSSSYRGKMFVLLNTNGDRPYICIRNLDGTYTWEDLFAFRWG